VSLNGLPFRAVFPAKVTGTVLERRELILPSRTSIWHNKVIILYEIDGWKFITGRETPSADPHAGCCGEGKLEAFPYPISTFALEVRKNIITNGCF